MTVTLKETFFRTVAMLVVSMQVCWGSDPPKSYGPSPPKDYYQNNYEPDIQRPLALFTEKPVNVASLVLIPVVQVPSADLKIIYKPQIDSVSKTEPIIMCKSSTKSFEATPAVLVPLQQPFYLYDERTLIPFPKTVTILHGGYRMSIPVGMVVAPIPVGVLKSGPVLVNTLYAIPASPVLVPSTIRFVPVPSYPSPPSYSPPSPPSYSPPSPPSYSHPAPSPPSYSHPAPSPPSYSHPAPSPPSYSHPSPPSYSHPSPPSYSHPSPPSYSHPSPPAAYPHPAPSPPAYSPPSSSSPAYSHPSPPPVYSHPSPPPVYSHPSPPPVYSHPSPPTPPPKYSLPAPPEPTYYQHAGDYGGDSAPKYGKLYSQYTADPPPPPFYNSKESPLLHQLREEAEKNRHKYATPAFSVQYQAIDAY